MRVFLISLAAMGLFIGGSQAVEAATYTVTVVGDENDGASDCTNNPGDCSLREAVLAANANAGDDTITLAASTTYTLSLAVTGEDAAATGDLDITAAETLTINGAGSASSIIDADDIDRVFHVLSGATLELNDLAVQNGSTSSGGGGGILNVGTLTLDSVLVTSNATSDVGGNFGAGINSSGTATIANSTISSNVATNRAGGGIYSPGVLTVNNSTITSNSAKSSAGLYVNGDTTIADSTISDNTNSAGVGGGIECNSASLTVTDSTISGNSATYGGAIAETSCTTITLENSTVSGNTTTTAAGAFYGTDATFTITNSTISGNASNGDGGAIFLTGSPTYQFFSSTVSNNTSDNDTSGAGEGGAFSFAGGTLEVTNSIIAGNTDNTGTAPDCDTPFTSGPTSNGYSIIGDTTGCSEYTAGTGDLSDVDPALAALADNGGSTQTHAISFTSLAENLVPSAACDDANGDPLTQDQRGETRPSGSACDAGAYEYQDQEPVVTVTGDNPLEVKQRADFDDPGATASDTEDGDLSADIQTSGAVDAGTVGSYTLTYSVTDSAGNTDSADRMVNVVSRGDVVDITPFKNNRIRVEYADGSTQTFTVFSTGSGKPKAKLSTDGERILVMKQNGRRLRVIDPISGEVLDGIKLRKNPQGVAKFRVFDYYDDARDEIIVATKRNNMLRTTGITLTAASNLRNKNTEKVSEVKTEAYKIRRHQKRVRILRPDGTNIVRYRVTETAQLVPIE
jgi:CSLREA domain-containing protein